MPDTTTVISFFVQGEPKAQPRPRAFARKFGDKYQARVYDAGTAEGWKGCIAIAARAHLPAVPLEGPIRFDADFIFPRPGRLLKKKCSAGEIWHTSKPDRDNLEKAALDCLKTIGLMKDDCQVCEGEIRKFYAAKGAPSGARVRITVLDAQEQSGFIAGPGYDTRQAPAALLFAGRVSA